MSSPLDITIMQARKIVLDQSHKAGWAPPELVQSQNAEVQQTLEILRRIREGYGDTIEIIARGIYSRRGRFILELIQNVEDCEFNHVGAPSISFEVSPHTIIIESNQDGFTETDVSQICRTGNSWKRGKRGYVGDKGIGFKSVFQVASRVDIQSNAFSFFFEYNGGDSSDEKLGIITPLVGYDPIPKEQRPLTRMALRLNDKTPYSALVADFTSIPETLLLFLAKIKEIKIKIHSSGRGTMSNIYRVSADVNGTTRISKAIEGSHTVEWRYHVVRASIEGLPDDPARHQINECEGVLAFPIDEHGKPRTHTGHDVYAFLPVCRVGFNFILQSDFLLQANRQEIIVESAWNEAIINHIIGAFCNAIVDFCAKPALRFHWMKFLPVGNAFNMNPVWESLASGIISQLKEQKILYAHDSSGELPTKELLRKPRKLRTLPLGYFDRLGLPLFADRTGENSRYLSLKYHRKDVETLKKAFDLQDIGDMHIFSRIEKDLLDPTSVMKNVDTAADWHSRAADLISSIWNRSPDIKKLIKKDLELIPLSDGRWVAASTDDLHFPSQYGPTIPQDVVKTVDPTAASNVSRRNLFQNLGVTEIEPAKVIVRLQKSYLPNDKDINIDISKTHLKYLYWHHADISQFPRLWIYNDSDIRVVCQRDLIYFPSDDDYGPLELLRAVPHPENPKRLTSACPVGYLNMEYLDSFPLDTRRHGLSWLDWLETVLGVHRMPRLKAHAGSLSQEFRYILKYRPEKIVGLLKRHWKTYRRHMTDRIKEEISQAEVTCEDNSLAVLSDTYFPLPDLTQRAQELLFPSNFMFLAIPDIAEDDKDFEDWKFLERFGVNFEADHFFYLDALLQHTNDAHQSWDSDIRKGILRTYEFVADHCNEMNRHVIIKSFQQNQLILHPKAFKDNAVTASWLDTQGCVWSGPKSVLDKIPLAHVGSYRKRKKVLRLFCDILGIKDADWHDYLDMLLKFRRSQNTSDDIVKKVQQLYELLSEQNISDEDWSQLLDTFEGESLIYVASSWLPPSACLWTSPVAIQDKAILDALYPAELEQFFTDRLRISPADLGTLVQGISSLASKQPLITDMKDMIWAINAMKPSKSDLAPLAGLKILPIKRLKGGSFVVSLRNSESNYIVVDRQKLADIFEDYDKFLDFSLEEVSQLHPFLHALELDKNYISRLCTEESACSDDGVLDVSLTEKFQKRAYYLLRCAVSNRSKLACGSPQTLYKRLAATIISRSDNISTHYTIHHESGKAVGPVPQDTGYVHVQERGNGWQVFVPDDRNAREVCYMKQLPYALAKLFKIDQSASENIGLVLNSRVALIEEVLEHGGVGKVPEFEPPPRRDFKLNIDDEEVSDGEEVSDDEEVNSDEEVSGDRVSDEELDTDEDSSPSEIDTESSSFSRHQDSSSPSVSEDGSIRLSPGHFISPPRSPDWESDEENDVPVRNDYVELLGNVIRIARQTTLPPHDAVAGPTNGQVHPGFDRRSTFGIRSQGQMNHDVKIGAAGELFVYVILKNLGLRSFGPKNWTSTIRKQVLVHPSYRDMGAWQGQREKSDLQYQDTKSILTNHLIEAGYLDESTWGGATPKYLIEVKTTTGNLGDRFFMSRNQFRLMQNTALEEGQASDEVYVIFRVYNLGKENLSVQIYVDPEAHRGTDLAFAEHTWTVTLMQ